MSIFASRSASWNFFGCVLIKKFIKFMAPEHVCIPTQLTGTENKNCLETMMMIHFFFVCGDGDGGVPFHFEREGKDGRCALDDWSRAQL